MFDERLAVLRVAGEHVEHAGGRPTSIASSAKASAVSGVYFAGLMTTVLPAASAGATFHANISSGKFHGMTWPTTPQAV